MDNEKFKNSHEDVVDKTGNYVSPLDDDYDFFEQERDRRNNPLDDDYVREFD